MYAFCRTNLVEFCLITLCAIVKYIPSYHELVSDWLCSMGFLRNPHAFLQVLRTALDISDSRFILFSAGYEPLEAAIESYAKEASSCPEQTQRSNGGVSFFGGRLFCFSGYVHILDPLGSLTIIIEGVLGLRLCFGLCFCIKRCTKDHNVSFFNNK